MFEITGEHIALLNDTDLRRLVALLCEAELRRAGFPVSAVTAGGDQNAADGGLDVRVALPASTNITGFIPRPATGFQVKVPDMQRVKILDEMRPGGRVRPVIEELASNSGAYLIVSSKSSTTDIKLRNRRDAMREAVSDVQSSEELALDFYDRDRLASWVRDHPGMVAQVREKIGQPIQGWRPYATWAAPDETLETEYLVDGASRIHDWQSPKDGSLPIEDGINRIRNVLARPKGVVRLVGLSGLGKTRLVQALFDERIGESALSPALAVYTDHGDPPVPSPSTLLRHFIQNGQRAIVVVDNCTPETHRSLENICKEAECLVSLITIEYDVRDDDIPENTDVFSLEPASDDVIESLLKHKIPWISQVNRRRITEFAGGNARMALALATTLQRKDSIATFSDQVLFKRLFRQRQSHDDSLLRAAEACSLVYSFEGNESAGPAAELPLLAGLVGLTFDQIYRYVGELYARSLVQRRGRWRALLPQALANKLASQAIERMHPDRIVSAFLERGSDRLQISFSRRLGYLHDSEAVQGIVRGWLSDGGILSNLPHLSDTHIKMFRNVAPVLPAQTLAAIESTVQGEGCNDFLDVSNFERRTWISLLKSIAYDADLFEHCALLLARFLMAEPPHYNYNSARDPFKNLFQLFLSGTLAPIEQRLGVIDILIGRNDTMSLQCALEALESLLKTEHFTSSQGFEFGARPRDYGLHPTTGDDLVAWYRVAVVYAKRLALSENPLSNRIRAILAKNFHGLWVKTGITDELVTLAHELANQAYWAEGWIAVCNTIRRHTGSMPPDYVAKLHELEKLLRPKDLIQKARVYVFSEPWNVPGFRNGGPGDEEFDAGSARKLAYENTLRTAEQLGREIAIQPDVLDVLLPDLVHSYVGSGRVFGQGLAAGAAHLSTLWKRLVDALSAIPENERNMEVISGFISSASKLDTEATAAFLDEAVYNTILAPFFPSIQTSAHVDERGAARIEASMLLGLAPARTYGDLSQCSESLPKSTLRRLIHAIAELPHGYEVAVKILGMYLYNTRSVGDPIDDELMQCGRELLRRCPFEQFGDTLEYLLDEIVKVCFVGEEATEDAAVVCRQFKTAFSDSLSCTYRYSEMLESLFRIQPLTALDIFLGEPSDGDDASLWDNDFDRQNPIEMLSDETLITWAQKDPYIRFAQLAAAITPFRTKDPFGGYEWKPIALQILHLAPDKSKVLDRFGTSIIPWSGLRAEIVESRRALLSALFSHADPDVAAWARGNDDKLRQLAEKERHSERRSDESFE